MNFHTARSAIALSLASLSVIAYSPPLLAQWQAPVNLGPAVNSAADEFHPAISPDGLKLIFDSDRVGGFGGFDLYQSIDAAGSWGAATNLGSGVNTAGRDYTPSLSPDGLTLYLTTSGWDLVQSAWTGSAWGPRVAVAGVNSASEEWAAFLSPNAAQLYFTAFARAGGSGGQDLWVSAWTGATWGGAMPVSTVNGAGNEYTGAISPDGTTMILAIDGDLYSSTNVASVWQTPVSLGPAVNAPNRWDTSPVISADGQKLYFSSERDGGFGGYDLYVSALGATDIVLPNSVALTNRVMLPAPNPFSRTTAFRYELRNAQHVTIQVFNLQGRSVATLVDRQHQSGRHGVAWDGRDDRGARVPAGVYFARVRATDFQEVRRVVLLK